MRVSRGSRLSDGSKPGWCVALLVLAFGSCKGGSGEDGARIPGPGMETHFSILTSPERAVDILFMVDNSSSMDPKQAALAEAFPSMIQKLQTLDRGLPDIRIGVISSDMGNDGTGGWYLLGNQGILWGNDPSVDPNSMNNKYATVKHISNGCGMDQGARWIEDIQNADGAGRSRNYTGDITNVFSCLAKAVGVNGCGNEHQLQSLRVALNPSTDINPQNFKFIRRRAYLAIVLISDEDDCSADPNPETNDGIFTQRTLGDTAALRCAARGHVCNGQPIPDYDTAVGYKGVDPFVARFSDCDAKDDGASSSRDRDYKALPLIRVRDMIDSVSQVKDRPSEQIVASGIIGWPRDGKLDGVEYRIDKDTTSLPVEQQKLWDYMPICKLPDRKSSDGNIYKAYGGFRLKKFLDAFQQSDETNVFSVCQPDFQDALAKIGTAIAKRMVLGCVDYPLLDADPNLPGIQADCAVIQKLSCDTPGQGGCLPSGYEETAIGQCRDGQGNPLDPENPQTDQVSLEARPCWYLRRDVSDLGCTKKPWSMRPLVLTQNGGALPNGSILDMTCMVCPDGQAGCQLETI
jgi:hypothetical protein